MFFANIQHQWIEANVGKGFAVIPYVPYFIKWWGEDENSNIPHHPVPGRFIIFSLSLQSFEFIMSVNLACQYTTVGVLYITLDLLLHPSVKLLYINATSYMLLCLAYCTWVWANTRNGIAPDNIYLPYKKIYIYSNDVTKIIWNSVVTNISLW